MIINAYVKHLLCYKRSPICQATVLWQHESRNFTACECAEECNIYFRDVSIIHLARKKKKHEENAKTAEKKKGVENITTWPLPRCVFQSASQLSSHHISSYHQSWFHVLFHHPPPTPYLALTVSLALKTHLSSVCEELERNHSEKNENKVAAWYIEQDCCGEEEHQFFWFQRVAAEDNRICFFWSRVLLISPFSFRDACERIAMAAFWKKEIKYMQSNA